MEIKDLKIQIRYRSHWIKLKIDQKKLRIDFEKGWDEPVKINVKGEKRVFKANGSAEYQLKQIV